MNFRKFVTSSTFFRFIAHLEQSGSRIPNAKLIKLTFSIIVTLYLTKAENITKICYTALIPLLWIKVLFLEKNADFLKKNADISKIKVFSVLKIIFSETTFQVSSTIITSFSREVILPTPPPHKTNPEKPHRD